MDTQDWGDPIRSKMISFIQLTRDTGEIFYVRPSMISAMGKSKGNGYTFVRVDGAIDWVRETPETISSLMDKAGV